MGLLGLEIGCGRFAGLGEENKALEFQPTEKMLVDQSGPKIYLILWWGAGLVDADMATPFKGLLFSELDQMQLLKRRRS